MSAVKESTQVREELAAITKSATSAEQLMAMFARALNQRKLYYNWVGFYMISKSNSRMLQLGPYVGAMTPHSLIALNEGLCGAAASTGQTVVVDDVAKDARYLACSTETRSEIVAPIFVRGKVVGELDIDSFMLAAFQQEDRELVEYAAKLAGEFLERHPH